MVTPIRPIELMLGKTLPFALVGLVDTVLVITVALLKEKPKPTDHDIDEVMQGNICRCGTYQRIRDAIKDAAATLA